MRDALSREVEQLLRAFPALADALNTVKTVAAAGQYSAPSRYIAIRILLDEIDAERVALLGRAAPTPPDLLDSVATAVTALRRIAAHPDLYARDAALDEVVHAAERSRAHADATAADELASWFYGP